MSGQPEPRGRRDRARWVAGGALALAAVGLGGGRWWAGHEVARARAEAHAGLEGVWVDDSGGDVSYQFREDGTFLVRETLPGDPDPGDPGAGYRPRGRWTRDGQSVSVRTAGDWGFDLVLGEDGVLHGAHVLDEWAGPGEHLQARTPVVLTRKPDAAGP